MTRGIELRATSDELWLTSVRREGTLHDMLQPKALILQAGANNTVKREKA